MYNAQQERRISHEEKVRSFFKEEEWTASLEGRIIVLKNCTVKWVTSVLLLWCVEILLAEKKRSSQCRDRDSLRKDAEARE
jgi:hypothetical protein